MTRELALDKLKESIKLCAIHYDRMNYAFEKIQNEFPLNSQTYESLSYDQLSYIDQLIFRFSKLQDSMGSRLFPAILENLGEDIKGKPFIDQLTKLEELKLLDNHKEWLRLRETRNTVAHEYPFHSEEIIEGLNLLYEDVQVISEIWSGMKKYTLEKFGV